MNDQSERSPEKKLIPYMTPGATWAFSIGTSIGWGSFVVTCSTYLASAGIMGTMLGLVIGMAVIFVVTRNLRYMICESPDAGGIYSYCRKVIGHDYGFITAWFLFLTYSAILWANITSVPLFARYFLGDTFRFGFSYKVFGYDVFFGNALLSIVSLILVALIVARSNEIAQYLMGGCAFIFTAGIFILLIWCLLGHQTTDFSYTPLFVPGKGQLNQIVRIAVISPWAFIGFENIAHFSEEFKYPVKKVRPILITSVVITTVLYMMITLLSVTAYPARYATWFDYIKDLDNLTGIEGVPAFYAVDHYLHDTGIAIAHAVLLCIILTSIIGNLTALSRLIYALGRDGIISRKLGELSNKGIPVNAVIAAVIPACFIPFLGRTAIGWIVDVTTLGATMIYGFMSYAVFRDAQKKDQKTERITGISGVVIMLLFVVMLLIPEIIDFNAMATETYFLFTAWSVLGLILFRWTMSHDRNRHFGRSVVVWVVLLLLILFTSLVWVGENIRHTSAQVMTDISDHFGVRASREAAEFLAMQQERILRVNTVTSTIIFVLFAVSVWIMIENFRHMRKREQEDIARIDVAEKSANTDPLTGVKSKSAYANMEQEFDDRIEKGEAEPFSVVVCDINDLKIVNDTQGHKAGDEMIKDACRVICKTFKHSPVFRIGGDEFVVILYGDDFESRRTLTERLNHMSDTNAEKGGIVIAVGISDYIAGQDPSVRAVFEQADAHMYKRKKELKAQSGTEMR